jgi:hypothetical protein
MLAERIHSERAGSRSQSAPAPISERAEEPEQQGLLSVEPVLGLIPDG